MHICIHSCAVPAALNRLPVVLCHLLVGLLGRFRPSIPLSRQELEQRGLWDIDRLTQPYIRQHLLDKIFGAGLASEVAAKYLVEYQPGCFRFRSQYTTEKVSQSCFVTGVLSRRACTASAVQEHVHFGSEQSIQYVIVTLIVSPANALLLL